MDIICTVCLHKLSVEAIFLCMRLPYCSIIQIQTHAIHLLIFSKLCLLMINTTAFKVSFMIEGARISSRLQTEIGISKRPNICVWTLQLHFFSKRNQGAPWVLWLTLTSDVMEISWIIQESRCPSGMRQLISLPSHGRMCP